MRKLLAEASKQLGWHDSSDEETEGKDGVVVEIKDEFSKKQFGVGPHLVLILPVHAWERLMFTSYYHRTFHDISLTNTINNWQGIFC